MQDELKTSVETLSTVVKTLKLTGTSAMTQAALVTGIDEVFYECDKYVHIKSEFLLQKQLKGR